MSTYSKLENWHWPQNRWSKIEYACPHGIGHGEEIHGCDGCCGHSSYAQRVERQVKTKPYKVAVEGDTMWEAFKQFLKDLVTFTDDKLPMGSSVGRLAQLGTQKRIRDNHRKQVLEPAMADTKRRIDNNSVELKLKRKWMTGKSTVGELSINGQFECYILEDTIRQEKVYGETAIPSGIYEVGITYSPRFKRKLPVLRDVPGFKGIRIHAGNTAKDTEGCLLPGQTRDTDFVGRSKRAFNALYSKLEEAQRQSKKIIIEVD